MLITEHPLLVARRFSHGALAEGARADTKNRISRWTLMLFLKLKASARLVGGKAAVIPHCPNQTVGPSFTSPGEQVPAGTDTAAGVEFRTNI